MTAPFNQFYFTDCTAATSVIGQHESSVRASSLPAAAILAARLHLVMSNLTLYDLPNSLRDQAHSNGGLPIGHAPIRLARMRADSGGIALIHSVFRSHAGTRPLSCFSHVVMPTANVQPLSAADSLKLWGFQSIWGAASGWVWSEPAQMDLARSKVLPPWTATANPSGELVSDRVLSRFLRGDAIAVPPDGPALEVTPARFRGESNRQARCGLLEAMLAAYLNQRRIYLVSEPGLAALLIFGLSRLVPPVFVEQLTFSTYESANRFRNSTLDVVNMAPECRAEFKNGISIPAPSALIDTCAAASAPAPDDPATAYARFAVEQALQGRIGEVESFWERWDRVRSADEIDRPSFCRFWALHARLERNPAPLTEPELREYVMNPESRRQLFSLPAGRSAVLDLARKDAPAWWPGGPADAPLEHDLFGEFRADFQALLVDKIVADLKQPVDVDEHARIANFCFERLLPALADESMSDQPILTVLSRLEKSGPAHFSHVIGAFCCGLDASCLVSGRPQHSLLIALLALGTTRRIPWASCGSSARTAFEHFRRLHAALYKAPPAGADWYRLRWLLKAVHAEPFAPEIMSQLIENIVRAHRMAEEDLAEVVACAQALLPRGHAVEHLADLLSGGMRRLADPDRGALEAALLSQACGGDLERLERVIVNASGTLSQSARSRLEASWQRLADERGIGRRMTVSERFTSAVCRYGPPLGFLCACAAAIGVDLSDAPRPFPAVPGKAIYAGLALCGLVLLWCQAWWHRKSSGDRRGARAGPRFANTHSAQPPPKGETAPPRLAGGKGATGKGGARRRPTPTRKPPPPPP